MEGGGSYSIYDGVSKKRGRGTSLGDVGLLKIAATLK